MHEDIRRLAEGQRYATARYHCPACIHDRKNKHDKPLSVTLAGPDFAFLCHHCGHRGGGKIVEERTPLRPVLPQNLPPSPPGTAAFNFLSSRGITRKTATEAGVTYDDAKWLKDKSQRAIGFPYVAEDNTYAIKWRGIDEKSFSQTGAAATLWQDHRLAPGQPLVITEGEIDCLSLWQAGVPAVSVPNGAPSAVSNGRSSPTEDKKYGYLAAAKDLIEKASKVILACDNDGPGIALGEEIARRVGRARCWNVSWPEGCKDANDVLRNHGAAVLADCIEQAQPWPVKGLYDTNHFQDRVNALYDKGLPRGESTGYQCVDSIYTVAPGQMSIVTGTPGSGKSTFIDNVAVNIAKAKGWKFALCSFENPPDIHISKLAAIKAQKPFFDGVTPRMTKEEMIEARDWVQEHFFFLHQADGSLSALSDILDLARTAVLRYGIRGLICDPYNFISRDMNMSETDWVSDMLTKLKVFAIAHDLHVFLCAHPAKMRRKEDGSYPVPNGMDIAGSAHFWNKADMGLTVHRPQPKTRVTQVSCWKTRFAWCGSIGETELMYDPATGTYFEPVQLWTPAPPPPRKVWPIN